MAEPVLGTDASPPAGVSSTERSVLELITVSEITEVAVELVRAAGENPPGQEEATAAVLADACRARGLAVETSVVEPARPNVSAVLGGGDGAGLLLLGHTDVVPVGEGWSVPPFDGVVRDGRLYGRGAADMKGGLAACVVAMSALGRAGVPLSGPVELAALVDEEETGKGVRAYLAAGGAAGYAGCVVAEPTDLATVVAARGDAYLEVTIQGRAAHSGNPDDGANAVHGAADVIADLRRWHAELAADVHPLAGPATCSVGLVRGGTGVSTVPAECVVVADRRLLPAEDAAQVLQAYRARLAALDLPAHGLDAEARMTMDMPGFETPQDHPLVTTARRAVVDAGGADLPLSGWTAACDGGFVARDAGVPVVVLGPGSVGGQAHRPDESVSLDELLVAARAYALAALRLLPSR